MGILPPLPVEVRAKYNFTEQEKQSLGADLAAKSYRLEGLDAERKSSMSDYKERIDRASSDVKRISTNINLGYEYRSYTCRIEKNYRLKVKEYYDVHTHRLIDTQKFDPQDFQQTFEENTPTAKKSKEYPKDAVSYYGAPGKKGQYFDKNGKEIKDKKDIQPSLSQPVLPEGKKLKTTKLPKKTKKAK